MSDIGEDERYRGNEPHETNRSNIGLLRQVHITKYIIIGGPHIVDIPPRKPPMVPASGPAHFSADGGTDCTTLKRLVMVKDITATPIKA